MRRLGVVVLLAASLAACGESGRPACVTAVQSVDNRGEVEKYDADAVADPFDKQFYYLAASSASLDHTIPALANGPTEESPLLLVALQSGFSRDLEAGDELSVDLENDLNFSVVVMTTEGALVTPDAEDDDRGTLEILELSESRVCVRVDFSNDVVRVEGIIDATVLDR